MELLPQIQLIESSEFFDAEWYLERYPDVRSANMNAAVHYLQFGAAEKRNPSPKFDTELYLDFNPSVSQQGINPLVHFLMNKKPGDEPTLLNKMVPEELRTDSVFNKVVSLELNKLLKDYLHVKGLYAGDLECPVCQSHPHRFYQLPDYYFENMDKFACIHSIFTAETFNFRKYYCIKCGGNDRDRLYALYLKQAFARMDKRFQYKFIDFAPSAISPFIKSHVFINYRSADINGTADDNADITAMPMYASDSVDAFLCSHILEHVSDDRKAMAELYRILKPGGWGICMVPIFLNVENVLENHEWTSEADRWKYFVQNDHVRMYSKAGFVSRLSEAGFAVRQLGIDHFGSDVFEKNGIHPRSVLYIVSKGVYSPTYPLS